MTKKTGPGQGSLCLFDAHAYNQRGCHALIDLDDRGAVVLI